MSDKKHDGFIVTISSKFKYLQGDDFGFISHEELYVLDKEECDITNLFHLWEIIRQQEPEYDHRVEISMVEVKDEMYDDDHLHSYDIFKNDITWLLKHKLGK